MSLRKKKHVREKIIDQKKGEKPKRGMRIEPMTKEKVEEETVGDGVKQGDQGRHVRNRNQPQGDQKEKEVQILLQPNRKDRGGPEKDQ